MTALRHRFIGEICGFGTAEGHRFAIGNWTDTPYGPFADVMHETRSGHRTLFAPDERIATFVATTYNFDEVRLAPISAERSQHHLCITTSNFSAEITIGGRTKLGRLLRAIPDRLATAPAWCTVIDPLARLAVRGVRTRGSAGNGRREWYGVTDQHAVSAVSCVLDGQPLGELADVWPPVNFGFSSTPRTPAIVSVTTTIDEGHRRAEVAAIALPPPADAG